MLRKMDDDLRIFLLIFILGELNIEYQFIKNPSTGYIEIPIDVIKNCNIKTPNNYAFFH